MGDDTVTVQIGGVTEVHEPGCSCEFCVMARKLHRAREDRLRRGRREIILRSVSRPDDPRGCWEWTRSLTPEGYGRVGWIGTSQLAHRVTYELFVGPIPEELQIDHRCRNRKCVNPDHLHAVTSKLNNENRGPGRAKSGIRNVHWDEKRKRWIVSVKHDRRSCWGGSFIEKDEAERAAIALRNSLYTNNLADRT